MQDTKRCRWCWKDKPLEEFRNKITVHRKREFGTLCAGCKEKRRVYNRKFYAEAGRAWYLALKEKRSELLARRVPKGQKRCRMCCNVKPEDQFWIKPGKTRRKRAPTSYCDECREKRRVTMADRRKRWTAEELERVRARDRRIAAGIKKRVIGHYGGQCECCGITEIEFLTIDHTNGDGHIERKNGLHGNSFYRYIIRAGFPDRYRCLCFNCNCSRGFMGYCPHEKQREQAKAVAIS